MTPAPKLEHYKLETEFRDGYIINTTYEWELSARRPKVSTWKPERRIGNGAFGSVWSQREKEGQLRAVKILPRNLLSGAGFAQELLALIKLKDASIPNFITRPHPMSEEQS